jgi:putative membrane protein
MNPEAATRREETLRLQRQLVYLAAERTLLTWIRASLTIMVLGFVFDRFALFLQSLAGPAAGSAPRLPAGATPWTGACLVVLGTFMNIFAAVRYWRFCRQYRQRGYARIDRQGIEAGIALALALACVGIAIAGFLDAVAAKRPESAAIRPSPPPGFNVAKTGADRAA